MIQSPAKKKRLFASLMQGIRDTNGASFKTIFSYFGPEFVTSFLLYFLPIFIDYYFIGTLKSTSAFATLGITTVLIHMLTKVAEGLSVGVVIVGGQYNGAQEYKKVGRTLSDAFLLTVLIGGLFFLLLFFGASSIYQLYGVTSAKMIRLGVPYLQLRAVGIFFAFFYFAFVGFLRSIKNPKVPMVIYALGSLLFIFLDWLLIFGNWGFPALGMQGSALASVLQMIFMLILVIVYIAVNKEYRKYGISPWRCLTDLSAIMQLLRVSWPVIVDKATMACAYIWLGKMLAPTGKVAMASFGIIRQIEGFAILPVAALAQVITFMVSNDVGAGDWRSIKSNIKKILLLSTVMVFLILLVLSINPSWFIKFFDAKGKFTAFSAFVFPLLNLFVFLDLLQLILSGALRGAANVNLVMWVRLFSFLLFFVPVSYWLNQIVLPSEIIRFLFIYGSFYIATGIMSVIYVQRFRSGAWKQHVIPKEEE